MDKPLVSAIITTHNRADLLPRALNSVLAQTYPDLEIIVVDDASTDDTESVIADFRKSHDLHYIKNKQSQGAAEARNIGIEAATGDFVAGLDDDDEWHADRISRLMKAYSDEFSCVTSDTVMVFPNVRSAWRKKKVIDLETLLYTNQVGNQVLVRKDRITKVGEFDTSLRAAQDYDLWVRLCSEFGPIRNVQKPLQTIYMDHEGERITSRSSFEGYFQFYNKHKELMNRKQRKYQLYAIRRAQGKPVDIWEFLFWVPPFRYWKELKKIIIQIFWGSNKE